MPFSSQQRLIKLRYLAGITATILGTSSCKDAKCSTLKDNGEPIYGPPKIPYKNYEFFGVMDYDSVRRGFKVFKEVCAACHSNRTFSFRHLVGATHSLEEAKEIAATVEITDGPNDEGEMFNRPGKITDYWPPPYPNREAAAYANKGIVPPDFMFLVNTKPTFESHILNLLVAYHDEPPPGVTVAEGNYYNLYAKNQLIAMAPPLYNGQVEYDDGTPATVSQMAKDVSSFMKWIADPYVEERKRFWFKGSVIIGMMIPFTFIFNRLFHNLPRYRKIVYHKMNWK